MEGILTLFGDRKECMQRSHLQLRVGQNDCESPTQRLRNTVEERITKHKDKSINITKNKHKGKEMMLKWRHRKIKNANKCAIPILGSHE